MNISCAFNGPEVIYLGLGAMEQFIGCFVGFRGRGEVSEDTCIFDHFCPVPVGEFR